jgi:uncharacterized repeat protein (TIGR03803 family)
VKEEFADMRQGNGNRGMAMAALLTLMAAGAPAQTFSVRYSFTGGADGATPLAPLVSDGAILYGVTTKGGGAGNGTVFAVQANGTNFIPLHTFAPGDYDASNNFTNADGAAPIGGLLLSGDILYGTAWLGGSAGSGTVFRLNTNGAGFTVLKTFSAQLLNTNNFTYTNSDGAQPYGGLLLDGNRLYGTTQFGGLGGLGVVFAMDVTGSNYTVLHEFTDTPDGAKPYSGLVLGGGTLYGTTQLGGTAGYGTVFALATNGANFSLLYSFDGTLGDSPIGGMLLMGGTLYGTAEDGGPPTESGEYGHGTAFSLSTTGGVPRVLFTFAGPVFPPVNTDGENPYGTLALVGSVLYGTTTKAGPAGNGTVFTLTTNGSDFAVLKSFPPVDSVTYSNADGAQPFSGVLPLGNALYGTTQYGGSAGFDTIFKIELGTGPPQARLDIHLLSRQVVLTWTNAGFNLQAAPFVTGVYTNVPGATSPYTNAATDAEMFFRLASP